MIEEKVKTNIAELLKAPKNGKYLRVVAREIHIWFHKVLYI